MQIYVHVYAQMNLWINESIYIYIYEEINNTCIV